MIKALTFVFFLVLLFPSWGISTEEYAEKTGKSCTHCHLDSSGGGELTKSGEEYLEKLLSGKESGLSDTDITIRSPASKLFRLFIGYLPILTGIFWFGTILYVHLILKPAYAAHGPPRGEVRIGLVSMAIMGITGTLLTIYRIPSLSVLYKSRFGILLLFKIALFLMMVFTGCFAVLILGPKLKKTRNKAPGKRKEKLSLNDLSYFDGTEGRPSYIGYKTKIYDMTGSEFWKKGAHFERHKAGEDLSDKIEQAPHDEAKILEMPLVGEQVPSRPIKRSIHERMFYFLAYFNLGVVLLIILILALWQWW
jgi:predicted heme/steroid binding protein